MFLCYYRLLKSTPCEMKSPTITTTIPTHFTAGITSPYIIHTANAVMAGIILLNTFAFVTPILRTT